MTECTNCGPDPKPIKIQNITEVTKKTKNHGESQPVPDFTETESNMKKIEEILANRLFYADVDALNKTRRSKRSLPTVVAQNISSPTDLDEINKILLANHHLVGKDSVATDIVPSTSNLMTQAVVKKRSHGEPPYLDRVAHVVTNIVHSPRPISYSFPNTGRRVKYPGFEFNAAPNRFASYPFSGVSPNRLVIRPAKYRPVYRFPSEPSFFGGSPYSAPIYPDPNTFEKYRKPKKVPAKVVDVHENHDAQYEYVEMDITHDGKQIPKSPPKYIRNRYNGYKYNNYNNYNDNSYNNQEPYRHESASYPVPKEEYGEEGDYSHETEHSRDPENEDSGNDGHYDSHEDNDEREEEARSDPEAYREDGPSESYHEPVRKPGKSNFVPSGHYHPQSHIPKSLTPSHRFIPVPRTLEEYHKLHGTKFLNSYVPDDNDEYTYHPAPTIAPYHYPKDEFQNPRSEEEENFAQQFSYNFSPKKTSTNGHFEPKTPTSFMSVAFHHQNPQSEPEPFFRSKEPLSSSQSTKYSQPLPNSNAESYRSTDPSNEELSSGELKSFLDSIKSQVYDDKGNLKSELKPNSGPSTDFPVDPYHKGNLKSEYNSDSGSTSSIDFSVNPYQSSHSKKKSRKKQKNNVKDLFDNTQGNYNKKHNYRNKDNYFATGNSNSNYNHKNTYSNKKNVWQDAGESELSSREDTSVARESQNQNVFDKEEDPTIDFQKDGFGKDWTKSSIPSESHRQVFGRKTPSRHLRRVKVKVAKKKELQETENSAEPIILERSEISENSTQPTNTTYMSTA